MKRTLWPVLLAALPASAHMMSMSSGDLSIDGTRGRYELRMPLYEIAHVQDPGERLLGSLRLSGGGGVARLGRHACREDAAAGVYVCTAEYDFPGPVDRLEVECRLAAATVPNHVHLLRAERDGHRDQALFDISFTHATLRFAPPSPAEVVAAQAGAGFARAIGGAVQVLFLAALVLAARSRRELLALAGMFLLGQAAVTVGMPYTGWVPAARFVEAAAALTVAYLAVEILLLPQAAGRWVVAGVLGGFHGLYLHLFLLTTGYAAGLVLGGAALAEVFAVALLGLLFSRLARVAGALRPLRVSASALLVFGMVWFFLRLRG